MKRLVGCIALMVAALTTASGAAEPVKASDIEGPFRWGGLTNVTRLHHLYFAGQPDLAALESARDAGIKLVINLRAPSEMKWDEKASVTALGMTYVNIAVNGRQFEPDALEAIEAQLVANRDVPTLIHCASSNRVGGWLATHLVTRHGSSLKDALEIGRKAGITKRVLETSAREYLKGYKEVGNKESSTAKKGNHP
ncbi:MAG: hypothetical protein GY733_21080 [bacterium]|nr:hypothetical protein [bacterium]